MQLLQGFGVWKEAGDTEVHGRNSDEPEVARAPPTSMWKTLDLPLSAVVGVPRRQSEYKLLFPDANNREDTKGAVPSSAVLRRLSELRQEPESDGGSSPDEICRSKVRGGLDGEARSGLDRVLPYVRVCDGQSLASPGRWAVDFRRYPKDPVWSEVSRRFLDNAEKAGTPELLTSARSLTLRLKS